MNSVTGSASAPEHAGKRVPPLLPFPYRPHPIASHSGFVCAGFPFSEWAIGLRAGFSLREKLTEFTAVLPYFRGNAVLVFRLGQHSFWLVSVYTFVFI